MNRADIKVGKELTYNDGRPGHQNVRATVLEVMSDGFVAQFEDRADSTRIRWNEPEWIQNITFED